jgi:SHS2 domain-containing protein
MDAARHWFAEHTGELEIGLAAGSLAELFAEAGRALAEAMSGRPARGSGTFERVVVTARDREALMVAWLDELLFLAERDKKVFGDLRVESASEKNLSALVRGEPISELKTQVKATTFHGLAIATGPQGLTATVILDI